MIFVSTTAQVTVVWITSGEGEDQQFRLAEYFTYDYIYLPFIKLTYLSCHCLPLILISHYSHSWQLFLCHACKCPMTLKLCL